VTVPGARAVAEKPEPAELTTEAPPLRRPPRWSSYAPDALLAAALLVTAFVARRDGLPADGLWHDDAWVAGGAVRGSFSQLFTVGSGQPGYTAALMGWNSLTGGSSRGLAVLTLIAGTLGPPALYLLLRRLGYARSISALLGGALVVATVHVLYSGRIKTYAFDPLIVIGLVVAVSVLARVRWRWPTALAWVASAILISSFSGFAFVATAVAGVILVLYAKSDRVIRIVAVAAQALGQVTLFAAMQQAAGRQLEELEANQEKLYDGHVTFSWNPLRFGGEVIEHLRRLAVVFPGGPGWWLTTFALIAVAGLVLAAFTKRQSVPARYLALILLVAFIGGVVGRFPFGPTSPDDGSAIFTRGERSTLWLIPVLAVGLAAALQSLRGLAAKSSRLRLGFDIVVYALAGIVVATALKDATPYPFPGSKSATSFVESDLHRRDVVLISQASVWPYAVESKLGVSILGRPETINGFIPRFADPRLHPVGAFSESGDTLERVGTWVDGADRVFVQTHIPGLGAGQVKAIEAILMTDGFQRERLMKFQWGAQVMVWKHQEP
jgi:hypothetical protein